ncbi:hypothetical protein JCGZ_18726 [Jatropha curcas]|uniref:Glycosyltransferase n=1 Tax=Jatropha curcas TaxID=180498 RepID=A0A067K0Q8_JATCU|nr:hypothetical protein JCGZ_18726 [Jatropha curcas]
MNEPKKLHIVLFPWLAFGHIIPFLELAKLLAKRGHKISFISTPKNIQRLPKIPPNLANLVHLVTLTLPSEDHLPPNSEATTDIPTHKVPYLKKAYDNLQCPLLQFLETSTPDWIIYDFAPFWLPRITADLGISSAFFSIYGGWSLTFFGSSSAMINGDDLRTQPEDFTVPPKWVPFPSKVAFRLHEAKKALSHVQVNDSGCSDMFRLGSVMAGCDVIAIRSCFELEGDFLRLVEQLHGKPTLPTGLLPPSDPDVNGEEDETWRIISQWLNSQNKGSVVYIAFGSEVEVSQQELTELAFGLELSGLPFFWTLRIKDNSLGLPNEFEERVQGRGLVWKTWVPQLRILSHESVGGILTHCGYSSIIEALYFGRALIMLPIALDQGLIARVFEEKKVGVEITRDEQDGSFTRDSVAESLRLVMVDKEGKEYRDAAKEMRELLADKDLHDRYVDRFVELLQHHRVTCNLN